MLALMFSATRRAGPLSQGVPGSAACVGHLEARGALRTMYAGPRSGRLHRHLVTSAVLPSRQLPEGSTNLQPCSSILNAGLTGENGARSPASLSKLSSRGLSPEEYRRRLGSFFAPAKEASSSRSQASTPFSLLEYAQTPPAFLDTQIAESFFNQTQAALHISANGPEEESTKIALELSKYRNCETIIINHASHKTPGTYDPNNSISSALSLFTHSLKSLFLSNTPVELVHLARVLQQSQGLKELYLIQCDITETGGMELARALKNHSLERLHIVGSRGPISTDVIRELLSGRLSRQLIELNIANCQLTDGSVSVISRSVGPQLRHLRLPNNLITSMGLSSLFQLGKSPGNLKYLDVSHNRITFSMDSHFMTAGLSDTTIRDITLTGNKIQSDLEPARQGASSRQKDVRFSYHDIVTVHDHPKKVNLIDGPKILSTLDMVCEARSFPNRTNPFLLDSSNLSRGLADHLSHLVHSPLIVSSLAKDWSFGNGGTSNEPPELRFIPLTPALPSPMRDIMTLPPDLLRSFGLLPSTLDAGAPAASKSSPGKGASSRAGPSSGSGADPDADVPPFPTDVTRSRRAQLAAQLQDVAPFHPAQLNQLMESIRPLLDTWHLDADMLLGFHDPAGLRKLDPEIMGLLYSARLHELSNLLVAADRLSRSRVLSFTSQRIQRAELTRASLDTLSPSERRVLVQNFNLGSMPSVGHLAEEPALHQQLSESLSESFAFIEQMDRGVVPLEAVLTAGKPVSLQQSTSSYFRSLFEVINPRPSAVPSRRAPNEASHDPSASGVGGRATAAGQFTPPPAVVEAGIFTWTPEQMQRFLVDIGLEPVALHHSPEQRWLPAGRDLASMSVLDVVAETELPLPQVVYLYSRLVLAAVPPAWSPRGLLSLSQLNHFLHSTPGGRDLFDRALEDWYLLHRQAFPLPPPSALSHSKSRQNAKTARTRRPGQAQRPHDGSSPLASPSTGEQGQSTRGAGRSGDSSGSSKPRRARVPDTAGPFTTAAAFGPFAFLAPLRHLLATFRLDRAPLGESPFDRPSIRQVSRLRRARSYSGMPMIGVTLAPGDFLRSVLGMLDTAPELFRSPTLGATSLFNLSARDLDEWFLRLAGFEDISQRLSLRQGAGGAQLHGGMALASYLVVSDFFRADHLPDLPCPCHRCITRRRATRSEDFTTPAVRRSSGGMPLLFVGYPGPGVRHGSPGPGATGHGDHTDDSDKDAGDPGHFDNEYLSAVALAMILEPERFRGLSHETYAMLLAIACDQFVVSNHGQSPGGPQAPAVEPAASAGASANMAAPLATGRQRKAHYRRRRPLGPDDLATPASTFPSLHPKQERILRAFSDMYPDSREPSAKPKAAPPSPVAAAPEPPAHADDVAAVSVLPPSASSPAPVPPPRSPSPGEFPATRARATLPRDPDVERARAAVAEAMAESPAELAAALSQLAERTREGFLRSASRQQGSRAGAPAEWQAPAERSPILSYIAGHRPVVQLGASVGPTFTLEGDRCVEVDATTGESGALPQRPGQLPVILAADLAARLAPTSRELHRHNSRLLGDLAPERHRLRLAELRGEQAASPFLAPGPQLDASVAENIERLFDFTPDMDPFGAGAGAGAGAGGPAGADAAAKMDTLLGPLRPASWQEQRQRRLERAAAEAAADHQHPVDGPAEAQAHLEAAANKCLYNILVDTFDHSALRVDRRRMQAHRALMHTAGRAFLGQYGQMTDLQFLFDMRLDMPLGELVHRASWLRLRELYLASPSADEVESGLRQRPAC
ncbi:hypothetical protein H696_00572 [Fonticula alba]|uniref:Uncharacterized protein n=1 Tax=Fonticula alba TaxID=691883 RepID=A0A058ZHQ0_FONAL|nr:hypothetical protein H696_00572 [Fonticula alba]KCV73022.1 hypothetical protein H696_00572 [Fonticula alba]|eukprot:XP_009492723.1 hypothetical protein H696_00572 [Fonticula alba]